MYSPTRALLIAVAVALPGCGMAGGGDVIDPELVRFCRQNGYAPGSSAYQWCLENYSMAGRGKQLDPRAAGRPGGGR